MHASIPSFVFSPPLIVLYVILFAGLAILGHYQEKERVKKLAAFAAARGWTFDGEKRHAIDDEFPGFPLFKEGSDRYGQNFMSGVHGGRRLLVFEYHHSTSSGKSTQHHYYTIVILHSSFPLKTLHIRPEGLMDRVASAFGWNDIDFESAEFSRRFHVTSPDRRWAFDVLTPRNMAFLMSRGDPSLSMNPRVLMVPVSGWNKPGDVLYAIATGTGLLDGIPRFAGGNA